MATFYEYGAKSPTDMSRGEITFKTNDPELHKRITDYIDDLIDAHQWRTRTEQIRFIDYEED